MKQVRRACLIVTFLVLLSQPELLLADECCQPFKNHCESFCSDKGGVMLTSCNFTMCTDSCFCWDIDPSTQQYYMDLHEEWCEGECS